MSHLASSQALKRTASQWILFPWSKRVQWPPEPGEVRANITNWPSFTVALHEPLDAIRIWQEAGASTVRVPEAEIQWLERLYTFRERAEGLWFLERYPFLVSLLLEAREKIGDYFPYSQAFLEVVTDPEATDDSQLVLFIATNLDPDEADERLEQRDEEWWLDSLGRAQGKLCIDVEFR